MFGDVRQGMEIQRYRAQDRDAVLGVFRLGLKDQERYARLVVPPENEGFFQQEWREHEEGLAQEPENWWVTHDGSTVTGILWMRYPIGSSGPYASVREIDVHPEHRNSGIGALLLKHAEQLARSTDAVMLLISALSTNPAVCLYHRLGFTDFPDRYENDKNPNHVVLWKPLRQDLIEGMSSEQPAGGDAEERAPQP
jgi:ribosomal protein S18 acetylase RimI-like enzyme